MYRERESDINIAEKPTDGASSPALSPVFLPLPFRSFNIPVFWPILLMYFFALFFLTMKRQIKHMIKYKYVPFSFGKTKYKGKEGSEGGMRSAD